MVAESLVVCVDCSDYTRNGDFYPIRLTAELDAVHWLARFHLEMHPDNEMACLSMGGKRAQVLVPFTRNLSAMNKLDRISPDGLVDLITSIRLALLILSHRPLARHKKRIIFFLGSPLQKVEDPKWIELALQLKKEDAVIEVVLLGSQAEVKHNQHSLHIFLRSLESRLNHFILIYSGAHILTAFQRQLGLQTEPLSQDIDHDLNLALQLSRLEQVRSTIKSQSTIKNNKSKILKKNYPKQQVSPVKCLAKNHLESSNFKVSKLLIPSLKQSQMNQNKSPLVKSIIHKNHKLIKSSIVKAPSHRTPSKFTIQPLSQVRCSRCSSPAKSLCESTTKRTTSSYFSNPHVTWPEDQKKNHEDGRSKVKCGQSQTQSNKTINLDQPALKECNPAINVKHQHIPHMMPPNIPHDHTKSNLSNTKKIPENSIDLKCKKLNNNPNNKVSKK